jgi:RsiW-degrading membrane proteinase PrsW (M82 family)
MQFRHDTEIIRLYLTEFLRGFNETNKRMEKFTRILTIFTAILAFLAVVDIYDRLILKIDQKLQIPLALVLFIVYIGVVVTMYNLTKSR